MPLCQPSVASSKHQWVTIKQDAHFAMQEAKIAGTWWSGTSGEFSWAYRLIVATTDTQIAYAGDITQIVADWETAQNLVSEQPLDDEVPPATLALERLHRHWNTTHAATQSTTRLGRSGSGSQHIRSSIPSLGPGSCAASTPTPTIDSPRLKLEQRTASFFKILSTRSETPFPGIPLHREGGAQPLPSPRIRACSSPAPVPRSATGEAATDVKLDAPSLLPQKCVSADAVVGTGSEEQGREREMEAKFHRGLAALELAIATSSGTGYVHQQNDEHYRVYIECLNDIMCELRALKTTTRTTPVDSTAKTAELLCLLSRASLDAARLLVEKNKSASRIDQVYSNKLLMASSSSPSSSSLAIPLVAISELEMVSTDSVDAVTTPGTAAEEPVHKFKEGRGDELVNKPGSGDPEPSLPLLQISSSDADGPVDAQKLQRCLDVLSSTNKSLPLVVPSV